MRSPIKWFGGKGCLKARLRSYLPTCHTYVEPFGGGASVLLDREPSPVEVYNDLDRALYDFFTTLTDPALFSRFYRRVEAMPYHRAVYNEYRATWQQCVGVERAVRWFVVARQSFSGHHGFGTAVTASSRHMSSAVSGWLSIVGLLPEIHARLSRVQFECVDWRVVLDRYDTPDTLMYCDPPYVHGTRREARYACEMSDQDHRDLVDALLKIKGRAALSGYACDLYTPLETAGWHRADFETSAYAAARTRGSGLQGEGSALARQRRVESLWYNYEVEDRS